LAKIHANPKHHWDSLGTRLYQTHLSWFDPQYPKIIGGIFHHVNKPVPICEYPLCQLVYNGFLLLKIHENAVLFGGMPIFFRYCNFLQCELMSHLMDFDTYDVA